MTGRRGAVPRGDGPPDPTRCSECGTFPAPHLADRQGRRRVCCDCAHPNRAATVDPFRLVVHGDQVDVDEVVDALVDQDRPRDERLDQ